MELRPEVKTFCNAAETLLSPAILQTPLTEAERLAIKVYMQGLGRLVLPDAAPLGPAKRMF